MSILQLNEPAMENLRDIMNDQPVKDRLHYMDAVLESANNAAKATLIQKLYTDVVSKNVNFGPIPDSKGDITKYTNFKVIDDSIGALNQLLTNNSAEELTLLNKLFEMVVSLRNDFEFGFKFDVEIIKLTYNTSVMSLHELINLCIMSYVNYLKDAKSISVNFGKVKKTDLLIVKTVTSLVKLYESGEWAMIMKQFKTDPQSFVGQSWMNSIGSGIGSAAQSVSSSSFVQSAVANTTQTAKTAATIGQPGMVDNIGKSYSVLPAWLKVTAGIVSAIIALVLTLRLGISLFYKASVKLDNWVNIQKEFLQNAINTDDGNTDLSLARQKKALDKFENISNFIEVHILKNDNAGKKELSDSNKEDFTKDDFVNAGFGSSVTLF